MLEKLAGLRAENAILRKVNAQLVAGTRKSTKSKRNLPTEARYLSKETTNEIRAQFAQKDAAKQAKKAQQALKQAQQETKKVEIQTQRALRNEARTARAVVWGGKSERSCHQGRKRLRITCYVSKRTSSVPELLRRVGLYCFLFRKSARLPVLSE